ncbi:uncharacterized protein [Nicotiana tomentosiformis]|uniref:uncharacterized protein n=1 Tax=Nicotiana tomentosiformis TaxID=4098 RepID=UPI00388C8945
MDASVLCDPSSTCYYVSSYLESHLDFPCSSLDIHVRVSIHVGDSIVVHNVYQSIVVTFAGFETNVDLFLLSMEDFNMIMGMDWLSPYHVILDYQAKVVTLAIPVLPRWEWKGSLGYTSSMVVSFLKAQRMVKKGCLEYLASVRDVSVDTPTVKLVHVVREFLDMF